ncbi:Cholinesterase [Termitomyces sp. J132]|nr:Cholinesterase [Termitomyces sp. J132]
MFSKFSALFFALSAFAQQNGLLVATPQGAVNGTLPDPSVRQFLGIPYASAERWEPPTLPPNRSEILNATQYSDSCLQNLTPTAAEYLRLAGFNDSAIFVPESETCLTLNIWTPSIDRKQSAAVLIWVHGGGFQFGTSNFPAYKGQNIVRDNVDIIVVTFNYRLNIFGFPNAPQLMNNTSQSQNFGLLDLDAAVQWVHDNIAAFGGDPERIVLFGQSAGGIAIDAYTMANPQDTRVKGVIEESGNLEVLTNIKALGPLSPIPVKPQPWNAVADKVGCGNVTDAAQLTCMKQVPYRDLENVVINTTAFIPISDSKLFSIQLVKVSEGLGLLATFLDITLFSDYQERAAAGNFLHVPLLGGSTENEADLLVVAAELQTTGVVVPAATEELADAVTEDFTCPAGDTARNAFNAHVPTWRYQYQGVFPDISTRPELRAYHTAEIPLVFGTMTAPTDIEVALSKFIQSAWVAFARDPISGLVNIGWPEYSPDTSTFALIGNSNNETGLTFTSAQVVDLPCNSTATLMSNIQKLETDVGL